MENKNTTGYKLHLKTEAERKEAQEIAFKMGYKWISDGKKEVKHEDCQHLYFGRDLSIRIGNIETYFKKHAYQQITLSELRTLYCESEFPKHSPQWWAQTIADKTVREAMILQCEPSWDGWENKGSDLIEAIDCFNSWDRTKEGKNFWLDKERLAQKGTLETRPHPHESKESEQPQTDAKPFVIDKLGEGHYTTRDGLPVRIHDLDGKNKYSTHGDVLLESQWFPNKWTKDGAFFSSYPSEFDLIPVQPQSKQPEQPETRPVNVGIPYTNEAERKAAIKQAEKLGYIERNSNHKAVEDKCIWLCDDGFWIDAGLVKGDETLPLDPSLIEPMNEPSVPLTEEYLSNFGTVKEFHTYPKSDYSETIQEDGTIVLNPINTELDEARKWLQETDWHYNAGKGQAIMGRNFVYDSVQEKDLLKLLVDFKNQE